MKVVVASSARLPTHRAYGVALRGLTHALSTLGHDVTTVAPTLAKPTHPDVDLSIASDLWLRFHSMQDFPVVGRFATWAARISAARGLSALDFDNSWNLLWTRSVEMLKTAMDFSHGAVLELHQVPSPIELVLLRRASGLLGDQLLLVAIAPWIAQEVRRRLGNGHPMVVEPSGVGDEYFLPPKPWPATGERLRLVYAGSFSTGGSSRGCDVFIRLARRLLDDQVPFEMQIVGGAPDEVDALARYRDRLRIPPESCRIQGRIRAADVPLLYEGADVLLANYPERISHRHASPLKLVEYAAASRPILATFTKSVKETLPPTAYVPFCEDDVACLQAGLVSIIRNPLARERIRLAAAGWAKENSWTARTARIIEHKVRIAIRE